MSYWQFDVVFLVLPVVLLLHGHPLPRPLRGATAALAAVALLWTGPWDDYLVRTGVWSYGDQRVLALVGSVPAEEYAFVALMVVLVAAWGARTGRLPGRAGSPVPAGRVPAWSVWAALSLLGAGLVAVGGDVRYLGLLLVWAGPPLALQRAVAGDLLRARRRARLAVALPCALWLCTADRLALADGIWAITPASSTGVLLLGLPLEEALFFVLTCTLVADGLLLAADPQARDRALRLVRGAVQAAATTSRTSRTASRRLAVGPSAPTGSREGTSAGIVSGTAIGVGSGSSADRLSLTSRRTSDRRTPRARQMLASSSEDASF